MRALCMLLGACIAIGVGIAIVTLPSDPPLLTTRATRIAALPSGYARYEWVSDHEIMMFSPYLSVPIVRLDTRTGAAVAMGGLLERFAKWRFEFTASPDGARGIWGGLDGQNFLMPLPFLDGSFTTKRNAKQGRFWVAATYPVWLQDDSHWLQLFWHERSLHAIVQGVDSHGIIRQISIGNPKGTRINGAPTARLLGCTQSGNLLAIPTGRAVPRNPASLGKMDFFEFSLNGGPARLREYTVNIPVAPYHWDAAIPFSNEVELSPHGDRLAWMVHVMEEEPPLRKLLSRWLRSLQIPPCPRAELRTSRLDGSDMKVIGYLHYRDKNKKWHDEVVPHGLHWLPDGTRVSFAYDGALWTVSAK